MVISDIRTMAAKIMTLNKSDMEAVVYDETMPVIVRKFANSLLRGNIKDVSIILDQTLGKAVERRVEMNQQISHIEMPSTEEIRALLATCSEEEDDEVGAE